MEQNDIKSLITLLDDPDKEIFDHVAGKLLSLGPNIIPSLETYWETSPDPILQERIENIIHSIQFDSLLADFKTWIHNTEAEILDGAVLTARYQYHELERNTLKNYLDIIKRAIWLELNHNLTPYEQINVFNHIFFGMKGYSGKTGSDPNLFFINKVIETKTGNAVSLGIIYQMLARELDIPVYGVNLPRHYVLAYCKTFLSEEELAEDQQKQVLFYINPMSKGAIFTRNEVKSYLEKINIEESSQCYRPCTTKASIRLMLEHLSYIYEENSDDSKVKEIKKLIELFQEHTRNNF
jgi:hypothetical protein